MKATVTKTGGKINLSFSSYVIITFFAETEWRFNVWCILSQQQDEATLTHQVHCLDHTERAAVPHLTYHSPKNKLSRSLYGAQLQRLTFPSRHLPPPYSSLISPFHILPQPMSCINALPQSLPPPPISLSPSPAVPVAPQNRAGGYKSLSGSTH